MVFKWRLTMVVDPKQFWEQKILTWEEGRYGVPSEGSPLLESAANRTSASLRFRMDITRQLLASFVSGKHVVEVGCGSGLLAGEILAMGAVSYTGYDIAEAAVTRARKRAEDLGVGEKAHFRVSSVTDLPSLDTDIVFSLGLLDWLNDEELEALFKAGGKADYLHAIAEKRTSFAQLLHRVYVHLAYGYRTGSYVPRYYTLTALEPLLQRYNRAKVNVFRHPNLSFAALISSLPLEG
jgi:SAM-dependent methyltransferase